MRLRPRYSLLSLLVLTALVAGGVKLWYGPHHMVVRMPLTSEEDELFNDLAFSDTLQELFAPVVYEYEYINVWNNRKYFYVRGYSTNPRPIPIYQTGDPEHIFLMREPNASTLMLDHEKKLAQREHLICWIYPMQAQNDDWNAVSNHHSSHQTARLQARTRCYIVSSRKKIYLLESTDDNAIIFSEVKLNDLDAEFRGFVAREFAKIPEPQFP